MNISQIRSTCRRACQSAVSLATVAALTTLLAACTTPPKPPPAPPAPPPEPANTETTAPPIPVVTPVQPNGDVVTTRLAQRPLNSAVLSYADRTRALAPPELAQEIARLGDLPDAVRTPLEELQLAVALGQTRNPADLNRALGATQRVMSKTTDDAVALHPMARLLNARYSEQKRIEDQLDKQNQALRESQRRNDLLNERLEAMRALERSLNSRPSPGSIRNGAQHPAPAP